MMMIALTAALIFTLAGFLILLDRRDRRDRVERASWLQRIQSPHVAVAEHHAQVAPPVQPASPLPMSDEEMAEMESRAMPQSVRDIIAQMEAHENGFEQPQDGVLP